MTTEWRYYQHALLPVCESHEEPEFASGAFDISFSKRPEGMPLFARYTMDFDCGYETDFWYTIKDEPFDLNSAKKKHRYFIRQGLKKFDIAVIALEEWGDKLVEILNTIRTEEYGLPASSESLPTEKWITYFGVFEKGTSNLVGWANVVERSGSLELCSLKTLYRYRKDSINAALIYWILDYYKDQIGRKYITNGTRSINHSTQFNEFLERMFGFRKAYCTLVIVYRPIMKVLVPFLKRAKKQIERKSSDRGGVWRQIHGVLLLDEFATSCKMTKRANAPKEL